MLKARASRARISKAAPVAAAKVLGMSVGELNDDTRGPVGIAADVSGVVVTEVAMIPLPRARHTAWRGDHRDRTGIEAATPKDAA